jgi:hypothetical protein
MQGGLNQGDSHRWNVYGKQKKICTSLRRPRGQQGEDARKTGCGVGN